jgi:hypothetical protein
MYFYSYPDTFATYLGVKSAIDSSDIDKNGNYSIEFHAPKSYAFDLVCGDSNLVSNLIVVPGSELKINFVQKGNKPEIFPGGEDAKFNTYLLMFVDTFYRNPDTKRDYYIVTNFMSIEEFTKYNINRQNKMLEFYHNYFGDIKLRKEYSDYALNTINYGIGVDRLMYLWKKRMKVENVKADSSYFKFITHSYLENKDGFNCPAYIRFLNLYIKDVYERKIEEGELVVNPQNGLKPQVEKYKLSKKLLNEPYSNIVISNIVVSDVNDVTENEITPAMINLSLDSLDKWFVNKYSIQ